MSAENEDLLTTLQKIMEIARSAAPKIENTSAKDQIERIAGLAESAIGRNQAKPGTDTKEGG